MNTLKQALGWAIKEKKAIGHFNAPDSIFTKAIFNAAQNLSKQAGFPIPVIVGASEGERDFFGVSQFVAHIKSLREENNYPIFSNADHTESLTRAKEAIDAGFDAVILDRAKESIDKNISQTKEIVSYAKEKNYLGLIEAELGYIGSGSSVLENLPQGAAITEEAIVKVQDAVLFTKETGVDLFAPAVGNVHGMLAKGHNPNLFISRIKEVADATKVPLVLHGGSGISNEDFLLAIKAGIRIVHVSTELRRAWREGIEKSLKEKPDEIAPYKVYPSTLEEMEKVVSDHLRLFNNL